MIRRSTQRRQGTENWLEVLRLERTKLSQDELTVLCEIPRATYQRWIAGKTEVKLSIRQLKLLCQHFGIDRIDQLPDDEESVALDGE
jgi:transcriptional regulator with XRE-family HTH domain